MHTDTLSDFTQNELRCHEARRSAALYRLLRTHGRSYSEMKFINKNNYDNEEDTMKLYELWWKGWNKLSWFAQKRKTSEANSMETCATVSHRTVTNHSSVLRVLRSANEEGPIFDSLPMLYKTTLLIFVAQPRWGLIGEVNFQSVEECRKQISSSAEYGGRNFANLLHSLRRWRFFSIGNSFRI